MGPGWRAPSVALVGGSVALFGGLRRAALALPRPAAVRSRPGRVWRWGNLLVSFAHSVLAGLWALFSLWQSPELLSDIQDGYSVSGHLLVCFSSGYFIHDSLDIIFNHQSRSSWEYLVHHAMAISAFVSLIITGRFLVAAMLLLLVEGQGAFLTGQPAAARRHDPHVLLPPPALRFLPFPAPGEGRGRGEVPHRLRTPPGSTLLFMCLRARSLPAPWPRALRSPPLQAAATLLDQPDSRADATEPWGCPRSLGANPGEEQPEPASAPAWPGEAGEGWEGRAAALPRWCWVLCALNGSVHCCRGVPGLAFYCF
uniref:TLC domain containing 1 n=1 Tax=Anas platyrhynchos TaxID=8839 RepID=A0A8B9R229_ANAPL